MKVYKYRLVFAYGTQKWKYREIVLPKDEFVEEFHNQYYCSDTYRGCDVEVVDAPKEYLEKLIEKSKNLITYHKDKVKKLKKELESYEKED